MAEPLSASLIMVWGESVSWSMWNKAADWSWVRFELGWEMSDLRRREVVRFMAFRPSRALCVRWQVGGINFEGCVKGCLDVGFAAAQKKFSLTAWIENRCAAYFRGLIATLVGVGMNLNPRDKTSSWVSEN